MRVAQPSEAIKVLVFQRTLLDPHGALTRSTRLKQNSESLAQLAMQSVSC
jgi:hypothetical protein